MFWGFRRNVFAVVLCPKKKRRRWMRHLNTQKSTEEVKKIKCQCWFRNLLSFLSQLSTLAFQSHVCFSMSKAKPEGQVIAFSPARVHLKFVCLCVFVNVLRKRNFIINHFAALSSVWYFFWFHNPMLTSSNTHYSNNRIMNNNDNAPTKVREIHRFGGGSMQRIRNEREEKDKKKRERKDYLNIICK